MPDSKPASVDDLLEEVEHEQARAVFARAEYRNRRIVSDLKSDVRALLALNESLERDIATLEALRPKPRPVKSLKPVKRARGGKLPAAFVALASDWHTCEIVTAKQTGGRNVHNQEIGTERAWRWAQGVVRMCKDEMARADVRTLVVWLGGDSLVNDGLHYKSERACDLSPPDEARFVRDLLAQIITYLRAELEVERIVIPTSWGNHDRTTVKMIPGHGGDYSYMQPVYRDLQAWFAGDKSIEFRIAESEWTHLDVHGYGLLFHHGHALKYGGGVGGLGVPLLRTMGRLRSDYDFDTLCIGHFHQRGVYQGGAAFSNGSLVGPNGYSMDLGLPSEPAAQVAFLVDLERRQVANCYAIWGD